MVTAQQATQFSRYSSQNAATVHASLQCGCNPYQDVFTYNRWLAQGCQVMRGEHGIHLPVIIEKEQTTDDGQIEKRKIHTGAVVFCRHQVKAINSQTTTPVIASQPIPVTPKVEKPATPASQADNIMAGWKVV